MQLGGTAPKQVSSRRVHFDESDQPFKTPVYEPRGLARWDG